jgi:hypothetical protein
LHHPTNLLRFAEERGSEGASTIERFSPACKIIGYLQDLPVHFFEIGNEADADP